MTQSIPRSSSSGRSHRKARARKLGCSTPAIFCLCLMAWPNADEKSAKAVIQEAIKAHGGQENLAKTLTGSLTGKATAKVADFEIETSITWQESFQLPKRYHRSIKGVSNGKEFSMEYAVTDGAGWLRQNDDPPKDFKIEKQPINRAWNAFLAMLPNYLKEGVKLSLGGKENVNGQEAIGIEVSTAEGDVVFFFDSKSGFLVKSKGRMDNPLLGKNVQVEAVYSDFKKVSGIQFPHRITSYAGGKKVQEMEIQRIEFTEKIDDRLFEKPQEK